MPLPCNVRHVLGVLALLGGSAALTGCGVTDRGVTAGDATGAATGAGYSASGARILQTGIDGQPRYRLQAARVVQLPQTREVRLESLQMQVRDSRDGQWRLTARGGLMPEDAGRVELAGDVRVSGVLRKGEAPMEIRSQTLAYDADAERVTTRDDVTIELSGRQLAAHGLMADLKARNVQLESRVHGRFVP
jgi:LPS export ABC transporter protein LptC